MLFGTIQTFLESIQTNSLLATLLGGGVIVTFFRYISEIFQFISKVILNLISFTIVERFNFDYSAPVQMKKLMFLLNTKVKPLWMRQIEIMKLNHDADSANSKFLSVPHGSSLFFLYGKLIHIDKAYETQGIKMVTYVTIRVFFCTKKKFSKLFLEDLRTINPKESNNNIEISTIGDWTYGIEKQKRSIDSIYNPDGLPKKLLKDIRNFISNEYLYRNLNIPYKRNYLFYGKPGTGKSSCVMALASEINWNIICVDVNKSRIDDITRNCAEYKNTIFLFEDIDAVTKNIASRRKTKSMDDECSNEPLGEVTLSQLLNLTDGLITQDKSICVFTTNHIEQLDEAFLRDGRMDVKAEFKYLDSKTAKKMLIEKTDIIDEHLDNLPDDICPAYLQELILKYHLGVINEKELLLNIKKK